MYFDPKHLEWPLVSREEKLRQLWVAIDFKKTEYHLSGYRGRVDAEDLAALLKGQLAGKSYLRVFDAYWFDESGDDWEQQSPKGILKRFGRGKWSKFTGDAYVRVDSILNVFPLKDGQELRQ